MDEFIVDTNYANCGDETIDGLTREEELEGLLAAVLDYWDEDVLVAAEEQDAVTQLMDRIYEVVNHMEVD